MLVFGIVLLQLVRTSLEPIYRFNFGIVSTYSTVDVTRMSFALRCVVALRCVSLFCFAVNYPALYKMKKIEQLHKKKLRMTLLRSPPHISFSLSHADHI